MNLLITWLLKIWKILTVILGLIYLEDLRTDGEVDLPHLSFEYNKMRFRRLALKLKWKIRHIKIDRAVLRKTLASLSFACIALTIYLWDNPGYEWFKYHWLPEMVFFAFFGSVLADKKDVLKRRLKISPTLTIIGLYTFLVVGGLAMSWEIYEWSAVPFSMLIATPLLITYIISCGRGCNATK